MGVTIIGLADREGETLAVFLAGLDCGDFPVIGGAISVPFGSDVNGYLTEHYLTQVSAIAAGGRTWGINQVLIDGGAYNVPCVVGYRFKSKGQLLEPISTSDTGAQLGPGFGKKKRNHIMGMKVVSAGEMQWGGDFAHLTDVPFRTDGGDDASPTELFTGVVVDAIKDDVDYTGQLCWEMDGPYSVKITAIGGFIETLDR